MDRDQEPLAGRLGKWLGAPLLLAVVILVSRETNVAKWLITFVVTAAIAYFSGAAKSSETGKVDIAILWNATIMGAIMLYLLEAFILSLL